MTKAIQLSDEIVKDAKVSGKASGRSAPSQIEYWAKIGKIAIENPDLPYSCIQEIMLGIQEINAGKVSEYTFG